MGRVRTKKIISELKKIKNKINKTYKIDKMLLFGSRAKGEELLTSDVDIIVISKDFSKVKFKKRPDIFIESWKLPVDIEVICYSPEEFKRKQKEFGLVREALKNSQLI